MVQAPTSSAQQELQRVMAEDQAEAEKSLTQYKELENLVAKLTAIGKMTGEQQEEVDLLLEKKKELVVELVDGTVKSAWRHKYDSDAPGALSQESKGRVQR